MPGFEADGAYTQRSPRGRLLPAAMLIVLAALAWYAGLFEAFGDAARVRVLLAGWGPWAEVLYVASFVLLQPIGIPAFFWVLPAGIVWPFWQAYALSLLGVAGAASAGFLFARHIARDWVASRLPGRARRLDEHFSARGLRSVILFRLVFQLGAPTHWLLGLSKVGYGTFVLGTVIGAMPAVAFVTYFGERAFHWAEMHATMAWVIAVSALAVALIARRVILARKGAQTRRQN